MPFAQVVHKYVRRAALATVLTASYPLSAQQIHTGAPGGVGSTTYAFGYCGIIASACGGGTYLSFAQSFTVPVGATLLDQFEFFMGGYHLPSNPVDLKDWQAFVAPFDQATHKIAGPIVYQTPLLPAVPYTNSFLDYYWKTFSFLGVPVVAGSRYLVFLSAPYYFANETIPGTAPQINLSTTSADFYVGGEALTVGVNGPSTLAGLTAATWLPVAVAGDFAFTASFTSQNTVPEPATMALCALGILAIAGVRAANRRAS